MERSLISLEIHHIPSSWESFVTFKFLPTMYVVWEKVMLSNVSVLLFGGGGGSDHEPHDLPLPSHLVTCQVSGRPTPPLEGPHMERLVRKDNRCPQKDQVWKDHQWKDQWKRMTSPPHHLGLGLVYHDKQVWNEDGGRGGRAWSLLLCNVNGRLSCTENVLMIHQTQQLDNNLGLSWDLFS